MARPEQRHPVVIIPEPIHIVAVRLDVIDLCRRDELPFLQAPETQRIRFQEYRAGLSPSVVVPLTIGAFALAVAVVAVLTAIPSPC